MAKELAQKLGWSSFSEGQQRIIHSQAVLSVTEAAEEYGVPSGTLRDACRKRRIANAEKRYGRWQFTRQALLNWMAEPQKTGRPRKWKKGK